MFSSTSPERPFGTRFAKAMATSSGAASSTEAWLSEPAAGEKDFRRGVRERDALAREAVGAERRKLRKEWAHAELLESHHMKKEDVASDLLRTQAALVESERTRVSSLQEAHDLVDRALLAAEQHVARPQPLFRVGQSVHVYWASWFAGCGPGKAPLQLSGKKRPSWFSSEIVTCLGWKDDLPYGGTLHSGYAYVAH
jgi:hypothetical protein